MVNATSVQAIELRVTEKKAFNCNIIVSCLQCEVHPLSHQVSVGEYTQHFTCKHAVMIIHYELHFNLIPLYKFTRLWGSMSWQESRELC